MKKLVPTDGNWIPESRRFPLDLIASVMSGLRGDVEGVTPEERQSLKELQKTWLKKLANRLPDSNPRPPSPKRPRLRAKKKAPQVEIPPAVEEREDYNVYEVEDSEVVRNRICIPIADLRNHIKSLETTLSERSNQLLECRETEANFPDSCPSGSPNGIYQIKPRGMEPFKVPCVSSPSGWSVILRRFDGSENFDRNWTDYKNGFGNVRGEFFIGLEKLHQMTNARPHELYIKLGKVDGSKSYAQYDDFRIGNEEESYELKSVGKYSGEAGDSLEGHVNKKFSTFDRDNDLSTENCALNRGGWWYLSCYFRYTALIKSSKPKCFNIFKLQ